MEGNESEGVFESLNLNPQLFINETLNTIDDLIGDAFHFYHQEASTLLKTDGTDRSQFLSQGIACIRNIIQSDLDMRLEMWEKYCLHHVFAVPEGFALPPTKESPAETLMCQDLLCDPDLDAQLDTLRNRLTAIMKESAELNREFQALKWQSAFSDHCAELVSEALQLHDEASVQDMFQDVVSTTMELREKMEKLRTRKVENIECTRAKRIHDPGTDLSASSYIKGLPNATVGDRQEFMHM